MTAEPSPAGPKLAIIIPTYRWNDLARDTLVQAAAIGSEEVAVHFGDNSADPEKHAWLRALAARSTNVAVTCHPRNLGADPNWLHLVKAQTAPYLCMAADDDSFTGSYYRAALRLVGGDPGCATASGLHVNVSGVAAGAPAFTTPDERLEPHPLARIHAYKGENAICYAVSRRAVIQGYAGLVETNPLPCPFYDYMLAFHLLSMGTYRVDRTGYAYLYDHGNWQGLAAFIASNKRWYKGYGLPESFGVMTRLHWGVMAAHFFSSSFRAPDLGEGDARAIAAYLFNRQRTEFIRDYIALGPEIDALFAGHRDAAAALTRLMVEDYPSLLPILDDFAAVVAVFSPGHAERHRLFQARTLLPGAERLAIPSVLTRLDRRRLAARGPLRLKTIRTFEPAAAAAS